MNTRPKFAVLALVCAAVPLWGQRADTPRITVMTFQSSEKGAGFAAAEGVRERLGKDFSDRQLYTLPSEDVKSYLEQSGFPPEEPLSPGDEYQLAKLVRADMYITGTVTKTATGYRFEPRLVLTREVMPAQPLPTVESRKLDDFGRPVAKALRDAMKQLDGEKKCIVAAGQGKTADAVAAARAAIAAYPQATMARQCVLNVYWALVNRTKTHADSVAYADSALATARELLQFDPKSIPALTIQSAAYKVKGDAAQARQSLLALVRADPTNTGLMEGVVNDLAATGFAKDAVPLVRGLLESNPGDPKTLNTAFLVYFYANDWKGVAETGPQLALADTTKADSVFYFRMATTYDSLHQPQQAAAQFAQLTAKYPKVAAFWLAYAGSLTKAGQTQQAEKALEEARRIDPSLGARFVLRDADALFKAGNADSAYGVLQQAANAPGADKVNIGRLALSFGNQLYQGANKTLDRNEFGRALRFLRFSNETSPSPEALVLIAASNVSISGKLANEAQAGKSCDLARAGREAYNDAKSAIALIGDNSAQAGTVSQLNQALSQIKPALDSEIKAYCK